MENFYDKYEFFPLTILDTSLETGDSGQRDHPFSDQSDHLIPEQIDHRFSE